jgi:hypothetical protein
MLAIIKNTKYKHKHIYYIVNKPDNKIEGIVMRRWKDTFGLGFYRFWHSIQVEDYFRLAIF